MKVYLEIKEDMFIYKYRVGDDECHGTTRLCFPYLSILTYVIDFLRNNPLTCGDKDVKSKCDKTDNSGN